MARKKLQEMLVAEIYPLYLQKVERKNHTKAEVDQIISWLTGYTQANLASLLQTTITFEEFFNNAPNLNPERKLITGIICGIRVENIEDSLTQEIRYLDKLIDELARGKKMQSILRTPK